MGSSPPQSTDAGAGGQTAQSDQASGVTVAEASDKYPSLAASPDKAPPATSSDEQKQVAGALLADRTQAQYSADALRAGTEPAANPPPPPAPEQKVADADSNGSDDSQADSSASSTAMPALDQSADAAPNSPISDRDLPTGPAPMPGALPVIGSTAASQPAVQTPVASAAMPAPAAITTSESPSAAPVSEATSTVRPQPATPAVKAKAVTASLTPPPRPEPVKTASVAPTAAAQRLSQPAATAMPGPDALGFQPSRAPALDPTVTQFVSPQVLEHYQAAVAMSASATAPIATPTADVSAEDTSAPPVASHKAKRHRTKTAGGVGGPEQMSGAVVANFDTLQAPAAPKHAYAAGAQGPTAVVLFPHDTTILSTSGRLQVQAAVEAFREAGEKGFIKVVGHSSSRTANMPLDRHLVYNFERSQARATAVARELIKEGVPADKVLVEAVGDSQPVYYESMPQGEEGNRRAEIFVES